jgi:hypothetical protein
MNNYRELTKYELDEIKKYLKKLEDIYNLQYFIEQILTEHYEEGYKDKEREVMNAFKNLITSQFVEKEKNC